MIGNKIRINRMIKRICVEGFGPRYCIWFKVVPSGVRAAKTGICGHLKREKGGYRGVGPGICNYIYIVGCRKYICDR